LQNRFIFGLFDVIDGLIFATVETMNGSMLLRFAVATQNDKLWTV
jgi:hypothetical protein